MVALKFARNGNPGLGASRGNGTPRHWARVHKPCHKMYLPGGKARQIAWMSTVLGNHSSAEFYIPDEIL